MSFGDSVFEMAKIEIANAAKKRIDKKLIEAVAQKVINGEKVEKDAEVSVAIVTPGKMRELNKKWRKTDCVTDVLSFSGGGQGDGYLGEIVICRDQVAADAKELKKTAKEELSWVVVHGMLHLLGYEHQKPTDAGLMRKKEEHYLRNSKLKNQNGK